ncbi:MAG: PEP-CTERM sorting domain-containing protein [Pseudomonadota bacterium]
MKQLALAATIAALSIGAANATTTVFEETWDQDALDNGTVLNFNGFDNWTVTDGFVDLISSGGFGLSCNGGMGGCIDADGSGSSATGMTIETTMEFLFEAGREYTFSATYSGSQRSGTDALNFSIDGLMDEDIIGIMSTDPFTTFTISFTPTVNTMAAIMISVPGPLDALGPIVDDILLTVADVNNPVPVPAALPLFLAGAAGLGALKRRKAA